MSKKNRGGLDKSSTEIGRTATRAIDRRECALSHGHRRLRSCFQHSSYQAVNTRRLNACYNVSFRTGQRRRSSNYRLFSPNASILHCHEDFGMLCLWIIQDERLPIFDEGCGAVSGYEKLNEKKTVWPIFLTQGLIAARQERTPSAYACGQDGHLISRKLIPEALKIRESVPFFRPFSKMAGYTPSGIVIYLMSSLSVSSFSIAHISVLFSKSGT